MKKRISFLTRNLRKLSKELEFSYFLSSQKNDFGYIEFKNGVRHFVSKFSFNINSLTAHQIAGKKDYADYFLKKFGHPIVRGKKFSLSDGNSLSQLTKDALSFVEKINFPLVIKPNFGAHGIGFKLIHSKGEFKKEFKESVSNYKSILVQEFVSGEDYRILVYRGNFICAYKRTPFTVTGDGNKKISELIEDRRHEFTKKHRRFDVDIKNVIKKLKRDRLTLSSVLKHGQSVQVLDNANLSSGGFAIDVSDVIHYEYKKIAINAAADIGFNLCGVDLMIETEINKEPKRGKWKFLELNASPGFSGFSEIGEKQYSIIMKLFKKILSDLEHQRIKI